jgi:hypothetical protein
LIGTLAFSEETAEVLAELSSSAEILGRPAVSCDVFGGRLASLDARTFDVTNIMMKVKWEADEG